MIRGKEFDGKAGIRWRHGGYKVVQKNKVPVGKPCPWKAVGTWSAARHPETRESRGGNRSSERITNLNC
jgi:hypothetical protein